MFANSEYTGKRESLMKTNEQILFEIESLRKQIKNLQKEHMSVDNRIRIKSFAEKIVTLCEVFLGEN